MKRGGQRSGGRGRLWLCCCLNPACKAQGLWFTPDGDREFFAEENETPVCPECGDLEEVWVYPY